MDGYGLVFAGGGGNGAFELGVWRVLRKTDKYKISAVSGASVGALNAALFAGNNYDLAEDIWQNVSNESIKMPFPSLAERIKNADMHGGLWSNRGIEKIIRREGFISGVQGAGIPCAVVCTLEGESLVKMAKNIVLYADEVRYFVLNSLPYERIVSILLASTAILHGFPQQKIDGVYMRDGDNVGRGDCMPVKPLYDMGLRKFIVVHLDNYKKMRFAPEDAEYIHIYPPHEMDNPLKIIDFSHESVLKRIKYGCKAAEKALEIKK